MANGKRKKNRTGSVISTRPLRMGKVDQPGTWLGIMVPSLAGGAVAALTTYGVQTAAVPTAGQAPTETHVMLAKWAPGIGVGIAAIAGLGVGMATKPAMGALVFAGGIGVGGALLMTRFFLTPGENATVAGLQAVVAERSPMGPLGAIVMERAGGQLGSVYQAHGPAAGAQVQVGGLSAINQSAFGTRPFSVH